MSFESPTADNYDILHCVQDDMYCVQDDVYGRLMMFETNTR